MGALPGWSARRNGFTLIELLTVIAIIGVLATLLMTAMVSANKKSRRAYCTSNLRQISLALDMYLDDVQERPQDFLHVLESKYLPNPAVFLCKEDKSGRWGNLVNLPASSAVPPMLDFSRAGSAVPATPASTLNYSYLHPWSWSDDAWKKLLHTGPGAGIAVCQLHGLGKQDLLAPSMRNFQGLILRARRDGAVVRRQHFWGGLAYDAPAQFAAPTAAPEAATLSYPFELFVDELPEP